MHRNKFSSVPTWPLTYSVANDKIGGRRGEEGVILIAVAFLRYDFIAGETRNSILDRNEQLVYIVDKSLPSFAVISSWGEKNMTPPPCLFVINNASVRRCLGLIYSAVKKIINGRGIFKGYIVF